MAGVTRIKVRETAAELEDLIQKQANPKLKERLQVLYLLKLPEPMSISVIAKVIARHRGRFVNSHAISPFPIEIEPGWHLLHQVAIALKTNVPS